MLLRIDDKEYAVSTSLRVAYDIEKNNKKKIKEIMAHADDMSLDEILNFIYNGFKIENPKTSLDEFKELVLSSTSLGFMEIQIEFQVFCSMLIRKNESEEEIREKLQKMLDKAEKDAEVETVSDEKN